MPPPVRRNVYIGYLVTEADGELTFVPFGQTGKSFVDAKRGLLTFAKDLAEHSPGVEALFYLRRGDVSAAANAQNIPALFGGRQKADVLVCDVVATDGGSSSVRKATKKSPKAKKPSPPQKFVAYCVIQRRDHKFFSVTASGYMKARNEVLKVAGAFNAKFPNTDLAFYIRNQVIPPGKKVKDLINQPAKRSELLVHFMSSESGRAKIICPGQLSPTYRPYQGESDRNVVVGALLDEIAEAVRSAVPSGNSENHRSDRKLLP